VRQAMFEQFWPLCHTLPHILEPPPPRYITLWN